MAGKVFGFIASMIPSLVVSLMTSFDLILWLLALALVCGFLAQYGASRLMSKAEKGMEESLKQTRDRAEEADIAGTPVFDTIGVASKAAAALSLLASAILLASLPWCRWPRLAVVSAIVVLLVVFAESCLLAARIGLLRRRRGETLLGMNLGHIRNTDAVFDRMGMVSHSATATCIPVRYVENRGEGGVLAGRSIHALIVYNPKYGSKCWMFPGGHTLPTSNMADHQAQTPEQIATRKAKEETGLEVSIIDLYGRGARRVGDRVDNMSILNEPHYSYMFDLDDNAECHRKKGHECHFDSVYVGEYTGDEGGLGQRDLPPLEESGKPYFTVYVDIPVTASADSPDYPTEDFVRDRIRNAVTAAMGAKGYTDPKYREVGNYPARMLCRACRDYIDYLAREGRMSGKA